MSMGKLSLPPQFLWFAKVAKGIHPNRRGGENKKMGVCMELDFG